MNNIVLTAQAKKALEVANERHWHFKVLGYGGVPTAPFYDRQWRFEPATEIPKSAERRINALKEAGITINGMVIAHEAPKLLAAPKEEPKPVQSASSIPSFAAGAILEGALLAFALIFQLALLDPALIVILPDGTWLEVMTWVD